MLRIVMPVKGNYELTKNAIKTLISNTNCTFELLVIEDEENSGTFNIIEDLGKEIVTLNNNTITYIENLEKVCRGVTYRWNRGIELAGKENIIAIVNNDVLFAPHWDTPLLEKIYNGASIASPYQVSTYHDRELFKNGIPEFESITQWHDNGYPILGACFMCRENLFGDIGLIDERLINWSNDSWIVRYCMEKEYKMVYAPESHIIHLYSQTIHKVQDKSILNNDVITFNSIIVKEHGWN